MGEEHQDTRLHRYFDGDLPADEAAVLRAQIEATPELRAKLGGLAEVRALVRETVAPAVLDLPSDDLWARIEAQLDADAAAPAEPIVSAKSAVRTETAAAPERAAAPALRAIEGGAAEPRTPARRPATPDPARGRRVVGIVIAGLALAAAVLLLVIRPGETDPGVDDGAIASGDGVDPSTGQGDVPETAEEIVFRTEVLAVDFGENSGAIFSIEGDDGESYSVVWLADVQPKDTAVE